MRKYKINYRFLGLKEPTFENKFKIEKLDNFKKEIGEKQ